MNIVAALALVPLKWQTVHFYPLGRPILRSLIFSLFVDLLVSNLLLLLICLWILRFKLIVFKAVFFLFFFPLQGYYVVVTPLICFTSSGLSQRLNILIVWKQSALSHVLQKPRSHPCEASRSPMKWVPACDFRPQFWGVFCIFWGFFFTLAASQETVVAINCGISGEAPEL